MSQYSPVLQKSLELAAAQAAKLAELQARNKEAAKEQLLRIQLLLSRNPASR